MATGVPNGDSTTTVCGVNYHATTSVAMDRVRNEEVRRRAGI